MYQDYYANISASVDDDDNFELIIRNAWHISGGKGAAGLLHIHIHIHSTNIHSITSILSLPISQHIEPSNTGYSG